MARASKIKDITKQYLANFPDQWVKQFDFSTEEIAGCSLSKAIKQVEDFLNDSFYVFSESVISGEYIVKDVKSCLTELADALCSDAGVVLENPYQEKLSKRLLNMQDIILEAIGGYRSLIIEMEGKCKVRQAKQFLSLVRRKPIDTIEIPYVSLYALLFQVALADLRPSYNEAVLKNLLHQYTELNSYVSENKYGDKIQTVCTVLRDKCLFLLKKILEADNKEVDYTVDYNQRHIGADSEVASYYRNYISKFEFYIKDQYGAEPIAENLDRRFFEEGERIWDLPLLIKYYKDVNNTTEPQIKSIVERFNSRLSSYKSEGDFDKYALSTLENYMANCLFSFKLSQENYDPQNIVTDIEVVEGIQVRTGIKNFYPYRKVIRFLISYIKEHRNKKGIDINSLLKLLDLYMVKLESALIWCRDQDFIPIQVPFQGCLVKEPSFGVIFVPSTYCRPLQYEKLFDELQQFKMEAVVLQNEAIIIQDKNEIEELKKQIDNSNKRLIDIFTLFVTITAFIFGCIQFFGNSANADTSSFLLNILSLGTVLLLFSSSVSMLTLNKENFWSQPRFWVSAIVMLIYLAMFVVLLVIGLK